MCGANVGGAVVYGANVGGTIVGTAVGAGRVSVRVNVKVSVSDSSGYIVGITGITVPAHSKTHTPLHTHDLPFSIIPKEGGKNTQQKYSYLIVLVESATD